MQGTPLTDKRVERIFLTWLVPLLREAGADFAETIHPHQLRHTYASLLIWDGADLRTVQELLGHEHLSTTEHYVKIRLDNKRAATNRLPSFE